MNNEILKEKNEFPGDTLNTPYVPDTLPQLAHGKIRKMMVEHFIKNKTEKLDRLSANIKKYLVEKGHPVHHVYPATGDFGPDGTKLIVLNVRLEGTNYFKHITQSHVDQHILELQQIKDNTTI